MIRFIALFLVLFATWLVWSGIYGDFKIIGLGVFSCLLALGLTMRMRGGDYEKTPFGLWFRLLIYTPWLIWEIVKANIDVSLCVLGVKSISPRLIRVPSSQKTAIGQTIYANSITLTPGTISLDVRDNQILVHALTAGTAEGLADGNMDRKSTWVEGSS